MPFWMRRLTWGKEKGVKIIKAENEKKRAEGMEKERDTEWGNGPLSCTQMDLGISC